MASPIYLCNLTVLNNNEKIILEGVIQKESDQYYSKGNFYKNPVKILKFEKIKLLGYENITNEFIEVKKSEEKRNKITGSYD